MNLKPGESMQIPIPMPPEIMEAVSRGAVLTVEQGPMMETRPNHYERMLDVRLDGATVGTMMLEWDRVPPPWYQRVWEWLLRRKPSPSQ